MIRGITEAIGDGAAGTTHGITEDIGVATRGIRTTQDGTADGIRIGAITIIITTMVRDTAPDTDMDMAAGTESTFRVMRQKAETGYSQEGQRQQGGVWAQAAASAEAQAAAAARQEAYQAL